VKRQLVKVQKRVRKKKKIKVLGMSEVLEYLMAVEESVTVDDPDGIVE